MTRIFQLLFVAALPATVQPHQRFEDSLSKRERSYLGSGNGAPELASSGKEL